MKLKDMMGTVIPFVGWKEYDIEVVEEVSEYVHGIEPDRRYSGFQVAWLGFMYGWGFRDIGPRLCT